MNKYLPFFILLIPGILDYDAYSFSDFVQRVELEHNIPHGLLYAMAKVESGLKPHKVTKNDGPGKRTSYGFLQIQEPSAKQVGFRGKPKDLLTPEVNIYFGAAYLSWLIKQTKGDVPRALNCWNAGPSSNICKNQKSVGYSDRVFNNYMSSRL